MRFLRRPFALLIPVLALSLTLGGSSMRAQLDGTNRGIDPHDSLSNFEVGGVQVDVRATNAEAARSEGWRRAQILGWRLLWSRTHNRPVEQAPDLPESTLSGLVDRAEARGLLAREPSPTDCRAIDVYLTRDGLALARRLEAQLQQALAPLTQRLPAADQRTLATLLARMLDTPDQ